MRTHQYGRSGGVAASLKGCKHRFCVRAEQSKRNSSPTNTRCAMMKTSERGSNCIYVVLITQLGYRLSVPSTVQSRCLAGRPF